jgi:hypothetical protein
MVEAALAAGVLSTSADSVFTRIRSSSRGGRRLFTAEVFFLEEAWQAFEAAAVSMERNTAEVVRARGKEVLRGRAEPGRRRHTKLHLANQLAFNSI